MLKLRPYNILTNRGNQCKPLILSRQCATHWAFSADNVKEVSNSPQKDYATQADAAPTKLGNPYYDYQVAQCVWDFMICFNFLNAEFFNPWRCWLFHLWNFRRSLALFYAESKS